MTIDPTFDRRAADRLLRSARRGERIELYAVLAAVVTLMSSLWAFDRALGGAGGTTVRVQAHPSPWPLVLIAVVAVAGRVLARLAEDAGGSPFVWLRWSRRLLVTLAFTLPFLLAAIEPAIVLSALDAGNAHPPTFGDLLLTLTVTPAS